MIPRLLCVASVGLASLAILPGDTSRAEWPHWRGPARNGISPESSGFADGAWRLREAWAASLGEGASAPIIAGGRLYTLGWADGKERVYCRDAATGAEIWTASYPAPRYGRYAVGDQGFYAGPSSAPEFDPATGLLYTLGIDGDLRCWDSRAGGRQVWGFNLYERYGVGRRPQATPRPGSQRDYGYTTAPLVSGDCVIVEVGDDEGNLMGFDRRSGERRWMSENKDPAGHTGGIAPMVVEGIPCAAVLTLRGLHVARLDRGHEGRTVAVYPWTTDFANNIASPAVFENSVILTSAYNRSAMCRLRITPHGVEKVWESRVYSPVCSPVIHRGSVYWSARGLWRLEFATGAVIWNGGRFGDAAGSCIVTADDRILVWANDGDLALADSGARSPDAYRELAWKGGLFRAEAWPHAALSGGRIFVKARTGELKCLETPSALREIRLTR